MTKLADEYQMERQGFRKLDPDEVILTCPTCTAQSWFVLGNGILECPNCHFRPSDMHCDIRQGEPH